MKALLRCATALALAFSASAASAATFTYDIFDNADGGLTSSNYSYGLRLDERRTDSEYFILSFEGDENSDVGAQLKYDDTNGIVQIMGTMTQSFSDGTFAGVWEVFYQMLDVTNDGEGQFIDEAGHGFGYVKNGDTTYELGAKSRSSGDFFYLRDPSKTGRDDPNYPERFVGEGWVNFESTRCCNDFLFTVDNRIKNIDEELTPVPLPAAGWLLIAAVGGLGAMKRRKGRS